MDGVCLVAFRNELDSSFRTIDKEQWYVNANMGEMERYAEKVVGGRRDLATPFHYKEVANAVLPAAWLSSATKQRRKQVRMPFTKYNYVKHEDDSEDDSEVLILSEPDKAIQNNASPSPALSKKSRRKHKATKDNTRPSTKARDNSEALNLSEPDEAIQNNASPSPALSKKSRRKE